MLSRTSLKGKGALMGGCARCRLSESRVRKPGPDVCPGPIAQYQSDRLRLQRQFRLLKACTGTTVNPSALNRGEGVCVRVTKTLNPFTRIVPRGSMTFSSTAQMIIAR